jgi:Domain of unknown function (DUF4143)
MQSPQRVPHLLSGAWAVRQLQPWFENMGKRQVRSPEIYVRDAGLLRALLDLETQHWLLGHPRAGAPFEGFVIDQILSLLRTSDGESRSRICNSPGSSWCIPPPGAMRSMRSEVLPVVHLPARSARLK